MLLSLSCPCCFNQKIRVLRKIASSFFGMKFGERDSGEVGRDAADWGVYICIFIPKRLVPIQMCWYKASDFFPESRGSL